MNGFYFVSLFLGMIVVFQPSLNRMFSEHHGLLKVAIINMTVGLLLSSIVFFMIYALPERFSSLLQFKTGALFRWWYLLPGMMGLTLVLFVPLTMKNIGAFPTIMGMLIGQILTSFIWDSITTEESVTVTRIGGLCLVVAGAYLSFKPA